MIHAMSSCPLPPSGDRQRARVCAADAVGVLHVRRSGVGRWVRRRAGQLSAWPGRQRRPAAAAQQLVRPTAVGPLLSACCCRPAAVSRARRASRFSVTARHRTARYVHGIAGLFRVSATWKLFRLGASAPDLLLVLFCMI